MTSLSSSPGGVRQLIARRTEKGWEVVAGELSPDENTYLIAQLSTPGIQRDRWASSLFDPPLPDTDYYARAGRAIATAFTMFHAVAARPYIATVIPGDDGPWWWVYFYPAPTVGGVWPRGGDMRFRVSADGRVITESRHLHETITDYSARTASSAGAPSVDRQPIVAGDTPEDTDVLHVIQRRPALPELMSAGRFQYRIDVDGTIRFLGSK